MKKLPPILALPLLLAGCQKTAKSRPPGRFIQCFPPAANYSFIQKRLHKPLRSFNSKIRNPFQFDLRSCDLRDYSIKALGGSLQYHSYDSKTKWPKKLPSNFNPVVKMKLGMNPGMKIRQLHKRGISGRGVSIAIIDQKLLVNHREYRSNLVHYEEFGCRGRWASMHGPSVTSLLAGKQCGTAPGVRLYYFGITVINFTDRKRSKDLTHAARAVDRILEINKTLPKKNKIRAISFSAGWRHNEKGALKLQQAMDRAKQAGMLICSANMYEMYGYKLLGLRRKALHNPDIISSYGPGWFIRDKIKKIDTMFSKVLLAPMDNRTTASPTGNSDYTFWGMGGISWSIPWLTGLYALTVQINPRITPEKFLRLAFTSGKSVDYLSRGIIVNPVALMKLCNQ